MLVHILLFTALSWTQDVLPFKPSDQFEIKMDLSFRQRPPSTGTTITLMETKSEYEKRTSSTPVPYLVLKVVLLHVEDNEDRLKIFRDDKNFVKNVKKLENQTEFEIEVGYVDDAKDHVRGYSYNVIFQNEKKKEVSQILIEFDKDGNYLVNGEKRGKL